MNTKFQPLTADELSQVSGGGFSISLGDLLTGGLDRIIPRSRHVITQQFEDPKKVESGAFDGINGAQQGDPSDIGSVTWGGGGSPFPGDGEHESPHGGRVQAK